MTDRREFLKISIGLCAAPAFASALTGCSSSAYTESVNKSWSADDNSATDFRGDMINIIRYATLAPSVRNTQPWQFRIYEEDRYVRLYADYSRRLRVADPDDRELLISIGCALENFIIASENFGYEPSVEYFPEGSYPEYIGIKMKKSDTALHNELFSAMTRRQTNHNIFDIPPVPDEFLNQVESLKLESGVCCLVMTDKKIMKDIMPLVREANRQQIDNLPFMQEYVDWFRSNDSEAAEHMDGLTYESAGMSALPSWLARFYVKNFKSAKAQSMKDEKNIKSSSAIIALFSDQDKKKNRILTGRSLERILLKLSSMNVRYDFINQPCQVDSTRSKLASLLHSDSWQPQILLRAGFAPEMPHSPRRNVSQVLI